MPALARTETSWRVSIEEGVTPSVGWLALNGIKGQTIATPYLLMRETKVRFGGTQVLTGDGSARHHWGQPGWVAE